MPTFKLFLFGAPRLERDAAVVKIPQRKALALLAYLAATGKIHARDTLATLFWPDHSQSEARLALSRRLSELNQRLPPGTLVLDAETVALTGDLWLDMADFEATMAAHPTVTTNNLTTLQAAVDLYTADFLAGFTLPDCPDFDGWQAFQSESLRQRLRTALEKIAWAQAATDDADNASATARRWLALIHSTKAPIAPSCSSTPNPANKPPPCANTNSAASFWPLNWMHHPRQRQRRYMSASATESLDKKTGKAPRPRNRQPHLATQSKI